MPVFAQSGGQPIGRYKTIESLSGEDSPETLAVVQFPSAEAIKNMLNSEAFKALAKLRSRVFSKLNLMLCTTL